MAVEKAFQEAGYFPVSISLGEVETKETIRQEDLKVLNKKLLDLGFEIIDDSKAQLIEKIKNIIIGLVHYDQDDEHLNYSILIESKLNRDYNYLSSLFSSVEGITIEKYVINQKIERVKELLVYGELTLSEIAFQMGYSSVAHLSNQFKKVTGLTPSHFKQVGNSKRKPLDEVI